MRVIETRAYKFNELSKEAKDKAIEEHREWEWAHGEYLHFFTEDCEEHAKELGFTDCKFQYSLSCSQGDGLSFSAENYEGLEKLFLNELGKGKGNTAKILAENCTVEIKGNNGRYCYASENDVELYIENYTSSINCTNIDNIEDVVSGVESELKTIYMDLCRKLEKQGYDEIDYQNSDECISETIESNEYEFTEDGKQI